MIKIPSIIKLNLRDFFFINLLNVLLFCLFLAVKRNLNPGILFYEGIYSLIISSIIIYSFFYLFSAREINKLLNKLYLVLISFLIILNFHVAVITIVDRSISIFMINNLKNGTQDLEILKKEFIEKFSSEAIDKRIYEQLEIGNVEIVDNKILLTPKGERFYRTFLFIQNIFNTDEVIIKG